MNKSLVTVGAVHTHTHTHTGICLVNRIGKVACKINFAGADFYAQNLIRDGWGKLALWLRYKVI